MGKLLGLCKVQPFLVCYGEGRLLVVLCRADSSGEHQTLAGDVESTVSIGVVWKVRATYSAIVEVPLCICYRRKDIVNL